MYFKGEVNDSYLFENRIAELEKLAITDDTTGLRNKRAFKYDFNLLLDSMRRTAKYCNSTYLAILDIDDFKKYNDKFGYIAGDNLLKALSDEICKINMTCECKIDFYRWGGEEFVFIFYSITKNELNKMIAKILNNKIYGVSIGITKFNIKSLENTFQRANDFLMEAKLLGKNRYVGDKIKINKRKL